MLSVGRRLASPRTVILTTSAAAIGGGGSYYLGYKKETTSRTVSDEHPISSTVGLKRQLTFWARILPVVADYYWHFASSSPYVKYQEARKNKNNISSEQGRQLTVTRNQRLQDCHQRHAPEILQVILELKGLFIKLGQVLSVSALPVPEPYRVRFRTLQDTVPGHEDFETIQAILEKEFGQPLDNLFDSIEENPVGAASIGQAHRAVLKETGEQVIVKIQYPDAAWQVPADIQCVGDFMKLCVWAGVLDVDAARMSFDEFARQFLNELDYLAEASNLKTIYESSIEQPDSIYQQHNIVVPRVLQDYCTPKVITMTYLPGSKLEEEARRQLELLGIDTRRKIGDVIREAADEVSEVNQREQGVAHVVDEARTMPTTLTITSSSSWMERSAKWVGKVVGLNNILCSIRFMRRLVLEITAAAVSTIQMAAPVLPNSLCEWATAHQMARQQAERLSLTESWIHGLFDVHGHQVFELGLFNADPHPGNILVLDKDYVPSSQSRASSLSSQQQYLGLIDFGQCKRLSLDERIRLAQLIVNVANNAPDDDIADSLRRLNIQTKNDSTEFLSQFARLMFGPFQPEHMDHSWHRRLHEMDKVLYFPNELAMVYRTSLLLRGLAISLQLNPSVSQEWRHHAEKVLQRVANKCE